MRANHPNIHVHMLWGIETLARLFSNPSCLDGKTVAFVRGVSEGTLPPTVLLDSECWDIYDTEVMSESKAATELLGLSPKESTILEETAPIRQTRSLWND